MIAVRKAIDEDVKIVLVRVDPQMRSARSAIGPKGALVARKNGRPVEKGRSAKVCQVCLFGAGGAERRPPGLSPDSRSSRRQCRWPTARRLSRARDRQVRGRGLSWGTSTAPPRWPCRSDILAGVSSTPSVIRVCFRHRQRHEQSFDGRFRYVCCPTCALRRWVRRVARWNPSADYTPPSLPTDLPPEVAAYAARRAVVR